MILRFTVNLDVSFTNNTAELPARSVKVQQRTSGGSWRTLQGLIDFAVVQSYLSTATKWGINTLDAMTQLFTTVVGSHLPSPPTSPPLRSHAAEAEQLQRRRAEPPDVLGEPVVVHDAPVFGSVDPHDVVVGQVLEL